MPVARMIDPSRQPMMWPAGVLKDGEVIRVLYL
jgi:hypothetical protein